MSGEEDPKNGPIELKVGVNNEVKETNTTCKIQSMKIVWFLLTTSIPKDQNKNTKDSFKNNLFCWYAN